MDTTMYKGLWTALVTPFKEWNWIDNEIDYDALEMLLQRQIDWWVNWILLLWTTWETPTLTSYEQYKIVEFAIKKIVWKVKVMVNVWTYSTLKSIENIKKFDKLEWIDAYLVVNPYYNKPTQSWLFKHFTSIAKSTSRDIFIYNILWRTCVNLETNTLLDIISECKNIKWVKESSWDIIQMKQVIKVTWDDFVVLSWDDGMIYDLIKSWWDWAVSVASNCIPWKMKEYVDACLNNDKNSEELCEKYGLFFDKLFIQTNPIPAKTYLASKWLINETFRLPICEMDVKQKEDFFNFINNNNY